MLLMQLERLSWASCVQMARRWQSSTTSSWKTETTHMPLSQPALVTAERHASTLPAYPWASVSSRRSLMTPASSPAIHMRWCWRVETKLFRCSTAAACCITSTHLDLGDMVVDAGACMGSVHPAPCGRLVGCTSHGCAIWCIVCMVWTN